MDDLTNSTNSGDDAVSLDSDVSSEWSEGREYEVKQILGKRVFNENGKSQVKYFVRWAGYSDDRSTWEPPEMFEADDGEQSLIETWEKDVADGKVKQDDEEIDRIIGLIYANDARKEKRRKARTALKNRLKLSQEASQPAKRTTPIGSVAVADTIGEHSSAKRKRKPDDNHIGPQKRAKPEAILVPKGSAYKPPTVQKFNMPFSPALKKPTPMSAIVKKPELMPKRRSSGREGQFFPNLSTANRVNKAARQEPNPQVVAAKPKTIDELDQENARINERRAGDPLGLRRSNLITVREQRAEREARKAQSNFGSKGLETVEDNAGHLAMQASSVEHVMQPARASARILPRDPQYLKWGKNGRSWYRDEIVIDLYFGKNHIGDCRVWDPVDWTRGAWLKMKERGDPKISVHLDEVWTKQDYVKTCTGRSNTVYSKGCVIPYEDTKQKVYDMANHLWTQNTVALLWHPSFDATFLFYSLDSPDWRFLENEGCTEFPEERLRFTYRNGLPRDPKSLPKPTSSPPKLEDRAESSERSPIEDDVGVGNNETSIDSLNKSTVNFNSEDKPDAVITSQIRPTPPSSTSCREPESSSDYRLAEKDDFNTAQSASLTIAGNLFTGHSAQDSPERPNDVQSELPSAGNALTVAGNEHHFLELPSTHSAAHQKEHEQAPIAISRSISPTDSDRMDVPSRLRNIFNRSIQYAQKGAKGFEIYAFYILYPDARQEEQNILTEFLEDQDDCFVYAGSESKGFEKFHKLIRQPKALGVILLHNTMRRYMEIPQLAALLKSSSLIPRAQQKSTFRLNVFAVSVLDRMDSLEHMERLFPHGTVILLTESLMRKEPDAAIAILQWFLPFHKLKHPGTWKLIVRPNVRPWLTRLLVSDQDPKCRNKWADMLAAVGELCSYRSIRYVEASKRPSREDKKDKADESSDTESVGLDGESDDEGISHPLISSAQIPRYGKPSSKSNVSQLTKDEHTMLEWFAGWACKKAHRYRCFVALTPESLKEWNAWNHIDIMKPQQFMQDMEIGVHGENPSEGAADDMELKKGQRGTNTLNHSTSKTDGIALRVKA
ncbi:MAG: hypothetical protein Q9227_005794 [Pyrenula ochraceoflavens]